MRITHVIISSLLVKTTSLETCKEISLTGVGGLEGVYETIVEYRGRPDFYREDSLYNLFGEDQEDGASCYWRIDSVQEEFPYYTVDDCSYHPVDISGGWWINRLNLDAEAVAIDVQCAEVKEPKKDVQLYLTASFCSLILIVALIGGHVFIRRRRLKRAKRECPVCRKSARDAARVIEAAFRTDNLKTLAVFRTDSFKTLARRADDSSTSETRHPSSSPGKMPWCT